MPRKVNVLPSPLDSLPSSGSSNSKKSEKYTASVHDADFQRSLRYRNVFIEHEDPSKQLMERAQKIISRQRASPEIDDATAREIRKKARKYRNDGEDAITKKLAPYLIPDMVEVSNPMLDTSSNQQWSNLVPLPLDPSTLIKPLPLPKPKPDLLFGYSKEAFSNHQLATIDLLIDDQYGRSFAVPDQKLRFPFLDIEFKSQAKNGTHYMATNQAAGAGAVALNGNLELFRRNFGEQAFNFDEPHFFSVTMDHQLACVNVHWIGTAAESGVKSFHVEGISSHLLNDANGVRALRRAIKNILDYGADVRLRSLCNALDEYRRQVVSKEGINTHDKGQVSAVQPGSGLEKLRKGRSLRGRNVQTKSTTVPIEEGRRYQSKRK
jgi:hypothetical protein